jgi:DNA-binding NtrC family response regulator
MQQTQLLIVDDETDLLQGLKRMLGRQFADLKIHVEEDATKALTLVGEESFCLVLLDIKMPGMSGLELLRRMRHIDPALTIIMMTGYGSIETAVEAMKSGAHDFITKPFDKNALFRTIEKGLEHNRLLRENIRLRQRVREQEPFANFVGQSKPMQQLYHGIRTTARTDYTVLIRGESGTGKELTARAIHDLSKRHHRLLVMVNCPAIPEHLLESELFGHRRGAFTGAEQDQAGLIAEAEGSTLCLDEIGDIPVSVQTKLLRFLQEQEIKPVGSTKTRSIDVRIIASTSRDLEKKIQDHSFREDLFYRLNVITLRTPTLREIREDIPLFVDHFSRQVCAELELPEKRFSLEALAELVNRDWPGNVRELQNVVRSAVLFCPDEVISPRYLRNPAAARIIGNLAAAGRHGAMEPYKDAKEKAIDEFTREYVAELLAATAGNVSRAAEVSGLTRAALQKIMRRYAIASRDYRES